MRSLKITDVRVLPGDSGFLLDDGKTSILYDTGFGFTADEMASKIKDVLGQRDLDYIFLTHSHYDHALGSAYILRHYPSAKVVSGEYTKNIFTRDGAKRTMKDLDRKFADKMGYGEYEFRGDDLRVDIAVKDGDMINAGDMTFKAIHLPGHTKCSFGYYCEEKKLLLSTETLGVYDGEDTIVPSYLVGYEMSRQSIKKALGLDVKYLLAPHFGLLCEEKTKFFMENMLRSTDDLCEFIVSHIKDGKTDEEITESFKLRYRKRYIEKIYPIDAVNLNTSIMINLIREEIVNKK
ncbi:MAG: MBL fold metallo-hydrolase [Eubacteriaceae bacterium]|nr:MBL fold metallo-hydrolase [Eubacteriaceae bacterium]